MSKRLATPYELQTVYGAEDLHNMLEIIVIDTYNENLIRKQNQS